MLYVEDLDGSRWLSVVELLSELEAHDMVLCLYPDSGPEAFPEPFSASRAPEPLERATTYPDGTEPPCSARVPVSTELLADLRPHIGDFEEWGDSLILFPPRERRWVAAFIPHERAILVQDVRLRDFLDAAGIPVGLEAPECW